MRFWRRERSRLRAALTSCRDRLFQAKRDTQPGTPAQLIGIVYEQPDEQAAINRAIEEFNVPANQRDRLIAQD
jgi:hypothetical protein